MVFNTLVIAKVKNVSPVGHRYYLHKFLIGVETIKNTVGANSFAQHRKSNVISLFYKGVCNTPLRSSPQGYRSRVGMLTIICVDTYPCRGDRFAQQSDVSRYRANLSPLQIRNFGQSRLEWGSIRGKWDRFRWLWKILSQSLARIHPTQIFRIN